MKIKFNYIIVLICLFSLISCILISDNCNAQSNRAELSFVGEPTYRLISATDKNIEGWRYQINITIENTGNKKSDLLIVSLQNETEPVLTKGEKDNIFVEAYNTLDISINWSTISSKDQDFTISFSPLNENTPKNSYNSGSTSFSLIVGDVDKKPTEDTPGFELSILLLSMILLAILIYKKN